jgi:prepilin-type N-terminal cleavage/methylation domain-containing protein
MKNMKKGFTLIEMLIAIAIFTVIAIAFIGILSVVTQVQVQSTSAAAVNQESQFLLQKLQYYIQTASIIDISTSTPTSTLKFDVASSSLDPSYITLASGTVYLQQPSGGALQPLTSNKVTVSNLLFKRNANPPGHDAVSISYTMVYNTSNIAQSFSQLFQTSIAQVSAATFDTALYASSNLEPLGNSTYLWSPINGTMNFTNGGNVGIGASLSNPAEQLSVQGPVQLVSAPTITTTTVACNATSRGTLLFFSPGGSSRDSLSLCAAAASGTLGWQAIY